MGKKEKKYAYSPKDYEEQSTDVSQYSEEDIEKASELVKAEDEKKTSKLAKVSAIWTLLSTLYAIISTCTFIAKDWVDAKFSIVLVVMLVVYIVIFIVLVVLTVKDPKKTKKSIALYKKLLKIFKSFANVVFLALSAVSMAGIAGEGMDIKQWVMFIVTFLIAITQLGLKVASLVIKLIRKDIGKHYKVKVQRYVDGKKQKKTVVDSLEEKSYK